MTLPTSGVTARGLPPVDDGTVRLPGGSRVESPVVVRVAGLPMAVLRRLCSGQAFRVAHAIALLRNWLGYEGKAISADLYGVIGGLADGGDKAALVGLRRCVFRVHRPAAREWNERVAKLLPTELAARLRSWTAARDCHDRLGRRLPEILDRETTAGRTALRDVARDPGFQRALSLSSPALFAETARWLADESRVPRRPALVRLAQYAAGAAARASPASAYQILGRGTWTRRGPDVRLRRPESVVAVTELNGHLLASLRTALREDPRLSTVMPLRLNPSTTRVGDTVRFLGPPPGESVVTVPATRQVLACLGILGDGGTVRREVLRDLLGTDDPQPDRLIDELVAAGLLERQLARGELGADSLDELCRWLTANGAAERAAAIQRVRSQLSQPAAVRDVPAHLVAQRPLGGAVDELTEQTGVATPPGDRRRPWQEHAVLTDPIGELSAAAWRPALTDLDVVRRLLAVLDPALSLRVALAAYCRDRFGSGARVPFLTLYESIAPGLSGANSTPGTPANEILELLGAAPGAGLGESRLPRLREVARLREDLWRAALVPPGPDGVIRPDIGALERLAASWPPWVGTPRSIACHLQVIPGDGLRVALNAAHGGHGRDRSRTTHLIRAAGGGVPRDRPAPPIGACQTIAELGGLFGYSPNARLPAAAYEIDYPYTVSDRPARQRLPLRDLSVVHDPDSGTVSLVAAGRRAPVTVQHLGTMPDLRLPPAARLLVQVFGAGHLVPAGDSMFDSRPEPATAGVHRLPRVEVGRVLVRRAQWIAPVAQVPARGKGESDAGYLVRLAGWLLAHGIPAQCFVRADASSGSTAGYVDFANWYLVRAFERTVLGATATVTFEEALPGPADALGLDNGDTHATEFVVEINARDSTDA